MSAESHPETLRTVPIDTSGTGDKEIIAAAPGKRWLVFGFYVQTTTTTNVTWKSGATALSGATAINTTFWTLQAAPVPVLIAVNANEALFINSSAGGSLKGWVTYGAIDA